jgi:hypothetical protein
MPTKRTPLDRRRTPPISAEMVELFKELEITPPRRRQSAEFKRRDMELHERLDLTFGRKFMSCSVFDGERMTYARPGEGDMGRLAQGARDAASTAGHGWNERAAAREGEADAKADDQGVRIAAVRQPPPA